MQWLHLQSPFCSKTTIDRTVDNWCAAGLAVSWFGGTAIYVCRARKHVNDNSARNWNTPEAQKQEPQRFEKRSRRYLASECEVADPSKLLTGLIASVMKFTYVFVQWLSKVSDDTQDTNVDWKGSDRERLCKVMLEEVLCQQVFQFLDQDSSGMIKEFLLGKFPELDTNKDKGLVAFQKAFTRFLDTLWPLFDEFSKEKMEAVFYSFSMGRETITDSVLREMAFLLDTDGAFCSTAQCQGAETLETKEMMKKMLKMLGSDHKTNFCSMFSCVAKTPTPQGYDPTVQPRSDL